MPFSFDKYNPKIKTLTHPLLKRDQSNNITGIVRKIYYQFEKRNDVVIPPGTIEYSQLFSSTQQQKTSLAYPFDEHISNLPIVGEEIDIFTFTKRNFYRRKNFTPNINFGANISEQEKSNTFAFKNIHRLELNEGDFLIQSRFGQSIRLGNFNNRQKNIDPLLIIRNGESSTFDSTPITEAIQEDINRDYGTISFSSGQYVSKFLPGAIDNKGKSNFELKVWQQSERYALEQYPKKLDGNQIVISSDRLIFSARQKEVMIFSKGVMSLVSDAYFTLDSNKGMNFVSHKGDIQFEANDQETKFFVGRKGKIFLGINKDDPSYALINGKALTESIGELIDEIIKLAKTGGILTPAGPSSGINPVNEQSLKRIMSKLPGTLSKKVFIGM